MRLYILVLFLTTVSGINNNCTCPCPCQPDGQKLSNLVSCFTKKWYGEEDPAHNDNSHTGSKSDKDIVYCKTSDGKQYCKFDGTNNLVVSTDKPTFYFNCGVKSCDAFLVGHDVDEISCIVELFNEKRYLRLN